MAMENAKKFLDKQDEYFADPEMQETDEPEDENLSLLRAVPDAVEALPR